MSRAIPVQFKSRRDDKSSDIGEVGGFGRQNRGSSAFRGNLEGGMGGRNVGGEWQVELPDAARDPREIIREQRLTTGEHDGSVAKTSGLEFRPEDYPALGTESADNNPLWIGKKGAQKNNSEDFPALSSGSRGTVITGWGGNVKATNKLTVMKPRGSAQSHQASAPNKQMGSGVKNSTVVGFHPPAPPPPKASKEKKMTPAPTSVSSDSDELTLAEKIKKEMTLKIATPVQRDPFKAESTILKAESVQIPLQHPSPPSVPSPNDYPALPTSKRGNKMTPAAPSLVGASWSNEKQGKTGSGIYLAKPKLKSNQASNIGELQAASDPPPGFVLLNNEPPPGFFTVSAETKSKSAPTETSTRKDFPGSWVSIGGSRGDSPLVNSVSVSPISDNDFPNLSSGKNVQGNTSSNQKKPKSKKQIQNELQTLAFKSK